MRGEYLIQYYFLWNDTSRFYQVLKVEVILTSVAVVVAVVVVVAEIISTRVVVAVGGGGNYLDTSGGSISSRSISGDLLFGVCLVNN